MPRDPRLMSHVAARSPVAFRPQTMTAGPQSDVTVRQLQARPLAEVVAAQPIVRREAVLFPTDRLEEARVINPELFFQARRIRPRPELQPGPGQVGQTRAGLGLPVAAGDPVEPNQIFQSADGQQALYLPRYGLARRQVSGSEQYILRLQASEGGAWTLRIGLQRQRPTMIPAEVTAELEHELLVQLRYQVNTSDGGTVTKTLDFTEIGTTAEGLVSAGLPLASLAERDQVLAAITSAGSACGVIVTRSVRVAVPVQGQPEQFRAVTRGLPQTADPDPLFLNPALHPYVMGGLAQPAAGASPGLVMKQLAYEGSFHDYWLDAVDPTCVYYLPDAFRLARRESPAPFLPLLRVRIDPGSTPEAEPVATMELAATPWTNPKRLLAARREFAKALPVQPGDAPKPIVPELGNRLGGSIGRALGDVLSDALGLQDDDARVALMRLEPLPIETASLWLALPGAEGGGLRERPAAQIDLRTAVILSETMPLSSFQSVYEALMGGAVSLMRGEVRVTPGATATKRIPMELRFDRMNGSLFETTVTPGETSGSFSIRLVNAVECPVTIQAIDGFLLVGGHEVATDESTTPPLPLALKPGEECTVSLSPKRPLINLPGATPILPMLDFSRVKLEVDGEALWAAVLDADTTLEARRRVRVKLFPGMFDAPDGKPESRAFAVIVNFENGPSLELTPEKPEGEVVLAGGSVTELVLRRAGTGEYRYKCKVIRRSLRLTDPDWHSDSTDILVPLLPEG